jgi:hypothetical protein
MSRFERKGPGRPGRARRAGRRALALVAVLAGLAVGGVARAAPPMDLANAEPRWVEVRFEISPAEHPGRTDAVYSRPLSAWLEPEADDARLRVTISGPTVESHLVAEQEPVPGSFSDFVWSFDRSTGHVHSATVEGIVIRTLDWGIARTRARARLRFRMDTLRAAGFRTPRSVLGQPVSYFCDPDARDDCVRVRPHRYDRATGYVNAVGPIEVENPVLGMRTFSTLGEARFHEIEATAADDGAPGDALTAADDGAPGDALTADARPEAGASALLP